MRVLLEGEKVIATKLDPNIYPETIEAPEDIKFGDKYQNGNWVKNLTKEKNDDTSNERKRQREYLNRKSVQWNGDLLTVEDANMVFLRYLAEGNPLKDEVQQKIIAAKNDIRLQYPGTPTK